MGDFKRLDADEIAAGLAGAPGWTIDDEKLFREFVSPRFIEAFGIMASVRS